MSINNDESVSIICFSFLQSINANYIYFSSDNLDVTSQIINSFDDHDKLKDQFTSESLHDYIPKRNLEELKDINNFTKTFISEKKETALETLDNKINDEIIYYNPIINTENKIYDSVKSNKKEIYSCKDITEILGRNDFDEDIIKRIKEDCITNKDKEKLYYFGIKTKQKRKNKINKEEKKDVKENISEDKIKPGRKKKNDTTLAKHNRFSSDNIIKKCKRIFFYYVVQFFNLFLKKYIITDDNLVLYPLNYNENINQIKKDYDLYLFTIPLKELLSLEISGKYKVKKNFNKEKIALISKKEQNNEVKYLLNMTFENWIDIFTLKESCDYDFEFRGLEYALKEIIKKYPDDDIYFTRLIFYLYNYKRWFINKKGRIRDENKNKE